MNIEKVFGSSSKKKGKSKEKKRKGGAKGVWLCDFMVICV